MLGHQATRQRLLAYQLGVKLGVWLLFWTMLKNRAREVVINPGPGVHTPRGVQCGIHCAVASFHRAVVNGRCSWRPFP